jgi:hypothetical protein
MILSGSENHYLSFVLPTRFVLHKLELNGCAAVVTRISRCASDVPLRETASQPSQRCHYTSCACAAADVCSSSSSYPCKQQQDTEQCACAVCPACPTNGSMCVHTLQLQHWNNVSLSSSRPRSNQQQQVALLVVNALRGPGHTSTHVSCRPLPAACRCHSVCCFTSHERLISMGSTDHVPHHPR